MGVCHVCGEPVGFGKTKLTAHALDLGVGVAVLDFIQRHTQEGRDRENIGRLSRQGGDMHYAMHEYAHRRGGMPPPLSELRDWQRGVNTLADWFSGAAPREWASFVAGIGNPQARRLVESMLMGRTL